MPEAAEHDVSHAVITAEKSDSEHRRGYDDADCSPPHVASCVTRHGPLHVATLRHRKGQVRSFLIVLRLT
jgi:hypothetical protein